MEAPTGNIFNLSSINQTMPEKSICQHLMNVTQMALASLNLCDIFLVHAGLRLSIDDLGA